MLPCNERNQFLFFPLFPIRVTFDILNRRANMVIDSGEIACIIVINRRFNIRVLRLQQNDNHFTANLPCRMFHSPYIFRSDYTRR